MQDAREFEGKTIDEAIERACNEFNVPREKLNIEILAEGSQGLFGFMGGKKARVSASLLNLDAAFDTHAAVEEHKPVAPARVPERTEPLDASDEETAAEARKMLEGILNHMGFDFPTQATKVDDYIVLNIDGDGSGILIGKGGQTLDAMQYIVNKAMNKNGAERKRIILDTENYREKKEKNLIALAERLAEKVRRTRKPITLNPMNAHDRRVIHLALQNARGLVTKSRGDGAMKKVVIIPSRKR